MNEQQNPPFTEAVRQYIDMALKIWPALKISMAHLSQAYAPPEGSAIPKRNYRLMSPQQFIETLGQDLHKYIMEHDVKSQHLEEYLADALAIFNCEEQNFMTIRYMSNQLASLLQELPQNDYSRFYQFREIYRDVQVSKGQVKYYNEGNDQSEDEEDAQNDDYSDKDDEDDEKVDDQAPPLMSQEEQQELEDDGWVVVKKKNHKK